MLSRYSDAATRFRHFLISSAALLLCSAICSAICPAISMASVIETAATSFTGDPLTVSITIDDETDPGNLVITLAVDGAGAVGDIRGFFGHVADESLVSGLSVSGANVTDSQFDANRVRNLKGGNNLNGGGSPCPCDLGVEIGTSGIGRDDIQSVTFTLSHVDMDLDVSFLAGEYLGVRATSVGGVSGGRNGSSKLSVIPEPATGLLMMLGLAGLAVAGRRGDVRHG